MDLCAAKNKILSDKWLSEELISSTTLAEDPCLVASTMSGSSQPTVTPVPGHLWVVCV